jgi:succinyl-diaminopimelate desuccinylase
MMQEDQSDAVNRVSAAVDALEEDMVEFLAALIRQPTVNPPGEGYRECAELIGERYSQLGYAVEYVLADNLPEHSARYPRVNVVGRRGDSGPTLHFNGHFDVVPPGEGWTVPPFDARIVDGKMYGRGTADQKAGIAASLYAVEALRQAGFDLRGTIEQSATIDEESGGFAGVALLCERGVIRAGKTNYVIITEPLGHDRICLGHRGVYWFEVIAHGRTSHGSMPGLGINAAELMAEFVTRLNRELKPGLTRRRTDMPVEPPLARYPTINLNSLHGGQLTAGLETPCVPDTCRAVFDRRFIVEESFEQVKQEIVDLVAQANLGGPGRFELNDLMIVQPVLTSASTPLVTTLAEAVEAVLERAPALIASPGTYDQKHVARIGGIDECVAYGPGILELAHHPDEYVEITHLLQSAKIMALTALKLLA